MQREGDRRRVTASVAGLAVAGSLFRVFVHFVIFVVRPLLCALRDFCVKTVDAMQRETLGIAQGGVVALAVFEYADTSVPFTVRIRSASSFPGAGVYIRG
jgi:hypothetical protein